MFIVVLRFSNRKADAPQWMEGHKAWIQRGLADGVFLLVGSVVPGLGGALLAHGVDRAALQARVQEDPFVAQDVVQAEILEVAPAQADARLQFLMA